jgi:ubiquinone/menaquinone biosynthesis C-methylase UbiE
LPASDSNPRLISDLANAFFGSCVLFTASDAGVFRRLAEQDGLDAAALARDLGQNERGMRMLADACVAAGLLSKKGSRYSLTATARIYLTPGSSTDLSGALRYNRDVYAIWGRLPEFLRTGKPVERPELHLGEDTARTRAFVLAMHDKAKGMAQAVLPLLDLAGRKRLLDVGGGPGTFSVLIAQKFPEIHCTVLDLPAVVDVARELIERRDAGQRVDVMAGDYHTTSFPSGLDAVNFFGMLHQESAEDICKLLSQAYSALDSGGIVQVMDMMSDESHTSPAFSTMFALSMGLTTKNGWVFSAGELRDWLKQAGFVDFTVQPLPPPMPHWLARARKP